jgi:hypothetical protein
VRGDRVRRGADASAALPRLHIDQRLDVTGPGLLHRGPSIQARRAPRAARRAVHAAGAARVPRRGQHRRDPQRDAPAHPYDSFDPVIELISRAADDPQVLAIKQTLYRTGRDSPIVKALARAAENGKQVTAIVELKARFDEASNIEWARTLEQSGVQVIYGAGSRLTKHALSRRSPRDRAVLHFEQATDEITARLYSDASYFTCDLIGQRRLRVLQRHHGLTTPSLLKLRPRRAPARACWSSSREIKR